MRPAVRTDPYPSRTADRPPMVPRREPVVWGSDPGPLDPELLSTYEEAGFLVLPGLLSASVVTALRSAVADLVASEEAKARPEAVIEPDGDELRSLFAVHRDGGPFESLARDPVLVGIARQVLADDVYVHQSRINLKPGLHGREFSWHSDFETWHCEDGMPRMRSLSCSVLLTPNHTYNGPLLGIEGSHRWFVGCAGETPDDHFRHSLRRQVVGTPDEASLRELVRRGRIAECTGPPGTVVLFDSNLMHGSNGNITPLDRNNVFIVYNAMDNVLEIPFAAPAPRPDFIACRHPQPI